MTRGAQIIFVILVILIIGLVGYALFSQDIPGATTPQEEVVTLQGTYICLPHEDTSGPQTLECAFGLRTDDGTNYALDVSELKSTAPADLKTETSIEVVGTVTPRDELDEDDRLQQYAIAGVIHVTSIAQTGDEPAASHTVAGGALMFERPSEFGLAVNQDQILVESTIPPCEAGFDYCLYFNESTYANTNFDSAGLRIEERPDLAEADSCLSNTPEGYSSLTPETRTESEYAVSTFSPIRSSAAGHSAQGALHRLAFDDSCYEFETRIGVSQIAMEDPSVEEFTRTDEEALEGKLNDLLKRVRFSDRGNEVIFMQ